MECCPTTLASARPGIGGYGIYEPFTYSLTQPIPQTHIVRAVHIEHLVWAFERDSIHLDNTCLSLPFVARHL